MTVILLVFIIISLISLAIVSLYMLITGKGSFFVTANKKRREKCPASLVRLSGGMYLFCITLFIVSLVAKLNNLPDLALTALIVSQVSLIGCMLYIQGYINGRLKE